MLVTYVGGPLHRRTERHEGLVTEEHAKNAVSDPSYSYKGSITSHGEVVEAIFMHEQASQADYESCERDLNQLANAASRFV